MLKTKILCFINNYLTGHNEFRGHLPRPIWEIFPYRRIEHQKYHNKIHAQMAELRKVRFDVRGMVMLLNLVSPLECWKEAFLLLEIIIE